MANDIYDNYSKVGWANGITPLNDANLGNMDNAIKELFRMVVRLEAQKTDKTSTYGMIQNVDIDADGNLVVTPASGAVRTYQTNALRIPVQFEIDEETQELVFKNEKGSLVGKINIAALLFQREIENPTGTSVILNVDQGTGHVSASIANGSITQAMVHPDFLASMLTATGGAATSASNAAASAKLAQSYANGEGGVRLNETYDNALFYSQLAESHSHGGTGSRAEESTDNSKYWCMQSKAYSVASDNAKSSLITEATTLKTDTIEECQKLKTDTNNLLQDYTGLIDSKLVDIEAIQNDINKNLELPDFEMDEDGNLVYQYEYGQYTWTIDEHGNLYYKR